MLSALSAKMTSCHSDLVSIRGLVTRPDVRTPLHIACSRGHVEVISLLIDSGADLDAIDYVSA
jgi:ankyrin repeat protein